ncbi:MAG TPA: ArsA-related P-loop ATPase [Solirubrobacteraceae bacterium]|nr:ArsA-related P-loop ATPase [Solirubrobacteraceae bacterium]
MSDGGIEALLDGARVCVCGGSGGVGKTTTAAAIALGMAAAGARVAVVTIDPARRLANALGLDELENEPRRVEPARLGEDAGGELWAMMLDPKRTFDELIERLAPTPERAEEIKRNRIYRELSSAVSGSQEFTAIAKLHELAQEGDFDLLVLDTPPSRNALDFLEAPGRLTSFLEGSAMRTLIRPTGIGMRVLGRGASPLLSALRRVTGLDLLSDLSTFFGLLGDMTEDFHRRAADVERLLHAPTTEFLLVTAASGTAIEEAIWFRRTLDQAGLQFAGAVVNRVHPDRLAGVGADETLDALADALGADLAERVAAALEDDQVLARRDRRNLDRLAEELGGADGPPILRVPQLDGDVHDVAGLQHVRAFLFASEIERERMISELAG